MKNLLSSSNSAIVSLRRFLLLYTICRENGKTERENSTIDHPDIRGLGTADQWAQRELASLYKRGLTVWLPRRLVARILRTSMYHPARIYRTVHVVCPTIAPQMNPASSRATAVAATCGGRFACKSRQYFLFRRFPARSAYAAISGDTTARSLLPQRRSWIQQFSQSTRLRDRIDVSGHRNTREDWRDAILSTEVVPRYPPKNGGPAGSDRQDVNNAVTTGQENR